MKHIRSFKISIDYIYSQTGIGEHCYLGKGKRVGIYAVNDQFSLLVQM